MTRFEGDNHLSGQDRHLWSLCYSTLERYGCPTMFKLRGPWAPARVDQYLTFFVPGSHPRAAEVKAYLEEELRHEARTGTMIEDHYAYGCQVAVEFFRGIDGFLTHEEYEPMREKFLADVMRMVEQRIRKPN